MVKRYSWLKHFLTAFWWVFASAMGFGIGTLLYGDPAFLRIVVLVWTVPCMAYYGLTEWLNILDEDDEDGGWG